MSNILKRLKKKWWKISEDSEKDHPSIVFLLKLFGLVVLALAVGTILGLAFAR